VLDLAGLPVSEHMQGHSLAAAVRGEGEIASADVAFIETVNGDYGGDASKRHAGVPFHRGFKKEMAVRTDRYVVGMQLSDDGRAIAEEHYLAYDLYSDPFQLTNLAGDPETQHWQEPLRARLSAWHDATPLMVAMDYAQ
jgi:arylsulfatase A-like enzyme